MPFSTYLSRILRLVKKSENCYSRNEMTIFIKEYIDHGKNKYIPQPNKKTNSSC